MDTGGPSRSSRTAEIEGEVRSGAACELACGAEYLMDEVESLFSLREWQGPMDLFSDTASNDNARRFQDRKVL